MRTEKSLLRLLYNFNMHLMAVYKDSLCHIRLECVFEGLNL